MGVYVFCYRFSCDYCCYVITITYLLSAVAYFLEYHLTEMTEKLIDVKLILKVALNTIILTPWFSFWSILTYQFIIRLCIHSRRTVTHG